jgi:hypothetical protein
MTVSDREVADMSMLHNHMLPSEMLAGALPPVSILANPLLDLPWQVVAGIMIFTTALIMWTRRRAAANATGRRHPRRPRVSRELTQRREAEETIRGLMLELEEIAREVNAQIDTRYRKLEAVIRDADRKIAKLQRLNSLPADADAARATGSADREEARRCDAPLVNPNEDAGVAPGRGTLDVVVDDGGVSGLDSGRRDRKPAGAQPGSDRVGLSARVRALARRSMSAEDIAEAVGAPIGEVELMLALTGDRSSLQG